MKIIIGPDIAIDAEMNNMAAHVTNLFGKTGYSNWDGKKIAPDGRTYVVSPSTDPRFKDYEISDNVEEIDKPEEWE